MEVVGCVRSATVLGSRAWGRTRNQSYRVVDLPTTITQFQFKHDTLTLTRASMCYWCILSLSGTFAFCVLLLRKGSEGLLYIRYPLIRSWDSSVGTEMGWPGLDSQQGQETLLPSTTSRLAVDHPQPSIQWVPGTFSSRIKQPER
jgi:hypothetical protein